MTIVNRIIFLFGVCAATSPLLALSADAPTRIQLADLRSFFHGDPPPVPKAPPPKQLAVVSRAPGLEPDPQIDNFLRAVADALKARDGKSLQSRLSDKYAIDNLPVGLKAPDYFAQAIDALPSPTEIIVKLEEKQKGKRRVQVELRYGGESIKLKTFRFDDAGKLLWTDWFQVQVQGYGI